MGIDDGGGGAEQLTEQETALYDRQIRVWGVDAQRRLSKSRILVCGVTGATAEFCKNIVLAGVGSLTLVDDRVVTEDALQANFLIIPNPDESAGRSLAELSCDSLRDFNPMVHVSVVKGDLSQFDSEFFDNFDAVIVGYCSLITKKAANNKCRNRPKPVPFYTVDCRDSCGEIFVDLQDHTYSKKTPEGSVECRMKYLSFEDSIAVSWKDLPRKISKLYYGMRVIERLEVSQENEDKDAMTPDLSIILKLRKELCEAQQTSETFIPTNLLKRLVAAGRKEHPPVCAILGGILGQEVIKALSGKGDPIKNFFYFDTVDGKGMIEDICAPAHS